jgi:hypothetical protein
VGLLLGLGRRASDRWALPAVLVWALAVAALAGTGWLADFDARPPRLMLVLVAMLIGCFLFVRSPAGRALGALSLGAQILFQSFRLPLELAMHQAAVEGVMPVQMSFEGQNFDILTGATALVVGPLALAGKAPRWLLIGWNALGTALLVNILVVAVASTPMFAAFGPDRLNTFVAFPPYVALPTLLVPTAIVGHALLWRRLLGPHAAGGQSA